LLARAVTKGVGGVALALLVPAWTAGVTVGSSLGGGVLTRRPKEKITASAASPKPPPPPVLLFEFLSGIVERARKERELKKSGQKLKRHKEEEYPQQSDKKTLTGGKKV